MPVVLTSYQFLMRFVLPLHCISILEGRLTNCVLSYHLATRYGKKRSVLRHWPSLWIPVQAFVIIGVATVLSPSLFSRVSVPCTHSKRWAA